MPSGSAAQAYRRFAGPADDWLADDARRRINAWQAEVRLGRLRQPVIATVGEVVAKGDVRWRSLQWTPVTITDGHRLTDDRRFPSFVGRIGLRRGNGRRPSLIMEGVYDPPGGEVGTALDALVLHKVAEISGLQMLGDIVTRLIRPDRVVGEEP